MGREAWHAAVHAVSMSWTQLSDWTELYWIEGSKESMKPWEPQIQGDLDFQTYFP